MKHTFKAIIRTLLQASSNKSNMSLTCFSLSDDNTTRTSPGTINGKDAHKTSAALHRS